MANIPNTAEYESGLIDRLASHIADVCANSSSIPSDLDNFKSASLLQGNDSIKKGKTTPGSWFWTEPYNATNEKNSWPWDSGLVNFLLFGRISPPNIAKGIVCQYAKTTVERIGIDDIIDNINKQGIEEIAAALQRTFQNNGLSVVNDKGLSKTSDVVKQNIISVGNLYYFARVFSKFIYENIFLIISPDTHTYHYIFTSTPNTENYGIQFEINTDFKSLPDNDKQNYLKTIFSEIFGNNGSGLFVKNIYVCGYEVSVKYANKEDGNYKAIGELDGDYYD